MKTHTILLLSAALLLIACDSGSAGAPSESPESPETEEQAVEAAAAEAEEGNEAATGHEHGDGHHEHHQPSGDGEAELVEVAAAGSRFDPAVEKAQIPPGSWICDMGTVHYARPDAGDGKCPICNMNLVELN